MEISIRQAAPREFSAVSAFYDRVIDEMQGLPYHPKWQKGIYPAEEDLKAALSHGELYLAEEADRIVGAMVMNNRYNEGYNSIAWPTSAQPHEVTVLHMLAVLPGVSRQGIGKTMVRFAMEQAQKRKQKVIRLDVLAGNLPAERLYQGLGFRLVQRVTMFYEDTGWHDFDLYEYTLSDQ